MRKRLPLDYAPPTTATRRKFRPTAMWLVGLSAALLLLVSISPLLRPRIRTPAHTTLCSTHRVQIVSALARYADRHAGHFPDRLSDLLGHDLDDAFTFQCPADQSGKGRYVYVGRGVMRADSPPRVVFYEMPGSVLRNAEGFLSNGDLRAIPIPAPTLSRPASIPSSRSSSSRGGRTPEDICDLINAAARPARAYFFAGFFGVGLTNPADRHIASPAA